MISGPSIPAPQTQAQPAAPKKEDPEIEEARRRAIIEERRRNRGSTVLTGQTGVTSNTPTQQTRLLAR